MPEKRLTAIIVGVDLQKRGSEIKLLSAVLLKNSKAFCASAINFPGEEHNPRSCFRVSLVEKRLAVANALKNRDRAIVQKAR